VAIPVLDFGIMAPDGDSPSVTVLLHLSRAGDRQAFDQLLPLVYGQLRRLANHMLKAERPNHTLQATALVHEAYARLVSSDAGWQDRVHFYSVAAKVMRHILVDYARSHRRQKRGSGVEHVVLDEAMAIGAEISIDLLSLDMAMQKLARVDQRKSDIIELMFFGGLTTDDAAQALDISPATLFRELKLAKAFLYRELSPAEA
jgi:RNA polymerase sigma factor (TIGR02999 family)